MSSYTKIEWSVSSWNPTTGCTKISAGCANCYAERMALRLKEMGQKKYQKGFTLTIHPDLLTLPLKWKKPRLVFVNSMSDLFHEDMPIEFIQEVFSIMQRAERHTFQILTKRSQRLEDIASKLPWPKNIWMGVTVEEEQYTYRINHLRKTPARIKFLSVEPLLSAITSLDLESIDWVIVGGESGPRARPMKKEWVVEVRDLCESASVPFFFKQWGGAFKKKNDRLLDGRYYEDMPEIAEVPFS